MDAVPDMETTYRTWEFTPGEPEPELIFETSFKNKGTVAPPGKEGEIRNAYLSPKDFHVIAPVQDLDDDALSAIKNGYFPFSELRIGMSEEEASGILQEPYDTNNNGSSTWYLGLPVTYSVNNETGTVLHLEVLAEAFTEGRTINELNEFFEVPGTLIEDEDLTVEWYEYVLGEFDIFVNKYASDDEWYKLQIVTKDE